MAVKNKVTRASLFFLTLPLAGCAVSLGTFDNSDSNYDDYYDSFGDLRCLYDGGEVSYDIEDSLFNEAAIQHFSWEKEEDAVKSLQYLYLVLPFQSALQIQSIALYVYPQENVAFEMSLFYFEPGAITPLNIKYLSSPDTRIIYDSEDNPIGEEEILYDDPPVSSSAVNGSTNLSKEQWNSLVFGGFRQYGYADENLHTEDGGLLYFRIENNSGFNRDRMQPIDLTFINLLVRAV